MLKVNHWRPGRAAPPAKRVTGANADRTAQSLRSQGGRDPPITAAWEWHAKNAYCALAGREKALGSDHTSTLNTVNNLGNSGDENCTAVKSATSHPPPRVLSWFARLSEQLCDLAKDHKSTTTLRRRPLAQPNKPIRGSTAERKLDIGFVNDPKAGKDSRCHWSQILVLGELKSNPSADTASKAWLGLGRHAREVLAAQDTHRFVLGFTLCRSFMRVWEFDRLGGIASQQFDINPNAVQFVSTILGFLWMGEEELGFDPTIISAEGERYIDINGTAGRSVPSLTE